MGLLKEFENIWSQIGGTGMAVLLEGDELETRARLSQEIVRIAGSFSLIPEP